MKVSPLINISILLLFVLPLDSYANNPLTPFNYCDTGRVWSSYGTSVKAKGPSYLLVNTSGRFRGDTSVTLTFGNLDFYVDSNFYGNDRTDYAGDAYKTIPFNEKGTFAISVAFDRLTGYACSYTEVVVHDAPLILNTSLTGGSKITSSISSSVDPLSKGSGVRDITYTFKGLDTSTTETYKFSSRSSSVTSSFIPRYNGEYRVSVSVSDGSYSDFKTTGIIYYSGGQQCTTCGDLN